MSITMKLVEQQNLPKKQSSPYQTQKDKQKERYESLKALGLCVTCKKPLDNNTTICNSCKQQQKEQKHYIQKQRIRQGLCIKCGKHNSTDYMTCRPCRDKYNKYIHRRGDKSE